MWPLDRAKMDSVCPSRSRSSSGSRIAHGSGLKGEAAPISGRQQLLEVVDDDVGSVLLQSTGLVGTVDADHEPEPAGPPGLHAGDGVLVDRRVSRRGTKLGRRPEVGVGRRLAGEVL